MRSKKFLIVRPGPDQNCEICKVRNLTILMDGRVRQGEHGPKGHFVYMCPVCHKMFGLSNDEENVTVYIKQTGKYMEQKGRYYLKVEEIESMVSRYAAKADPDQLPFIMLLGEMAIQSAIANRKMEEHTALLRKIVTPEIVVEQTVVPLEEDHVDGISDEV